MNEQEKTILEFFEWLPKNIDEFANVQSATEMVETINKLVETDQGKELIKSLFMQFQQSKKKALMMAKKGAKIDCLVHKFQSGGKSIQEIIKEIEAEGSRPISISSGSGSSSGSRVSIAGIKKPVDDEKRRLQAIIAKYSDSGPKLSISKKPVGIKSQFNDLASKYSSTNSSDIREKFNDLGNKYADTTTKPPSSSSNQAGNAVHQNPSVAPKVEFTKTQPIVTNPSDTESLRTISMNPSVAQNAFSNQEGVDLFKKLDEAIQLSYQNKGNWMGFGEAGDLRRMDYRDPDSPKVTFNYTTKFTDPSAPTEEIIFHDGKRWARSRKYDYIKDKEYISSVYRHY